jgi:flagellar hook-basal body complex protein FliE
VADGITGVGGAGSGLPGAGRTGVPGVQETDRGSFRIPLEGEGKGPSFASTLEKALGQVSELQADAKDAISAFLRGEPVEVHEVMAAAEEAGIALEMLIEVRNKFTEAYRTVINMQT